MPRMVGFFGVGRCEETVSLKERNVFFWGHGSVGGSEKKMHRILIYPDRIHMYSKFPLNTNG